ncbi:hypothetical protein VTK56DRAFT_3622 [Thermocarpiscus australiensis]
MPWSNNSGLQTLPSEILLAIAYSFPGASTYDPIRSEACRLWLGATDIQDVGLGLSKALASLARTCRTLYDIVNPVLYQQPRVSVRLIRTLADRPDLAGHVRNLLFPDCFEELSAEDESFVLDLASRYTWVDNPHHNGGPAEYLKDEPDDFLSSLLIAMCPNVESLSIGCGYFYSFPFVQPGSLPRLKYLHVAHTDTELGTSLANSMAICRAAPDLEVLEGFMISHVGSLPLQNVRELFLWNSAISHIQLRKLLRSCPRLESFGYEAGGATSGDYQFLPADAERIIARYAPQLKRLELDLRHGEEMFESRPFAGEEEDSSGDGDGGDEGGNVAMSAAGVSSLRYLETVTLDGECLPREADETDLLISRLPKSIRSVTLLPAWSGDRIPHPGPTAVRQLARAARDVFPNLRVIKCRCISIEEGRELSEATGVDIQQLSKYHCR